jgi:hypothetical protein
LGLPFGTAILAVAVFDLSQIRSTLWWIGFVLASPIASGWGADAQSITIPREQHAWAKFTPGSWSKVRKWTEELDEQGKVKSASTTETKTTLIGIDESGCTLQTEVTVEVAGKRFVAQPRQVRVGFDGGTNGARTEFRKAGEVSLELGGKAISCAILESTSANADTRIVSRLHYSGSVPPFIFRREIVTTSADGKQKLEETTMDAVAVEMPQKVLTELLPATHVRTVQKQPNSSTFTLEVVCLDVPGGVVAHTSKDLNPSGTLVRRSALELLDYGVADPTEAARRGFILQHTRMRRAQVPPRYQVPIRSKASGGQ